MVVKTSSSPWLFAQAFPKTGETPSLNEGEDSRPSSSSYLYLHRSTFTALPPPSAFVQAAWLVRMARGAIREYL